MAHLIVVQRTWVKTLQLSVLATCNEAFPVGTVDNLFAVKEHLQALPARLLAMVTKAIRQGAATALVAA
jgi:hypothetical protein